MKASPSQKQKVIVIVGPTGSGKTGLSLKLAKKFKGEVISADSRQVYKGLNIGTEKVGKRERKAVPHHLIDVANPKNTFAASDFRRLGEKALKNIWKKDHVPFVVGGTGFYIRALIDGIVLPEVPPNASLRKILEQKTVVQLFELLLKKDPTRSNSIDRHNPRRLIRALEIAEALGKVPNLKQQVPKYETLWIGLTPPSKNYEKLLKARLLKTLKKGLLKEIEGLRKKLTDKRVQELGLEYRIGLRYLSGQISKREMVDEMVKELRRYAKRQMTWFKANKRIHWLKATDLQKSESLVRKFLG